MRKWSIAGLAVIAIGVGWYGLSQPRKGTIDYHKKKFLEAHETGLIGDWIVLHAPMALHDLYWRPKQTRIDFHRNALLEAGYLAQREFVVSNRPATDISGDLYNVQFVFTDANDLAGMPFFYRAATNRIRVVARAIDMDKWEDVIRQADVPETR